jgi:hypothetical protein
VAIPVRTVAASVRLRPDFDKNHHEQVDRGRSNAVQIRGG